MGADMTLSLAALPHYDDNAKLLLKSWVDDHPAVGDEFWYEASRLVGILRITNLELSEADVMDSIFDDDEAGVIELRRRLQHAVRDVIGRRNREVAVITVQGKQYMASGGLSWGDPPTDACELLDLISNFDLFEAEIEHRELALMLNAGVATCGTCNVQFPDIYPSARCPFEYEHTEGDTDND